jgi:tetratricopeptide (TPR) repeat protein
MQAIEFYIWIGSTDSVYTLEPQKKKLHRGFDMKAWISSIAVVILFIVSGIAVSAQSEAGGGGSKPGASATTDTFRRKFRAPTKRTAPKRIAVKKTSAEYEAEGDRLYEQKDNDSAIVAYENAVKIKPTFHSLYRIGWIHNDFGEFAQALTALDRAIAIDDAQPVAYTEKGYAQRRLGQLDQATASFEKAISLDAEDYISPYELGSLYREKKMYDEADRYLKQSIRNKPENAKAFAELGDVQFHLDKNSDAISSFNKAISLDAKNSEAYMGLGDVYFYGTHDYRKAVDAYLKGLELEPENEEAAYKVGYAYNDFSEFQNALTWLNKAVQLKPGYVEPRAEIGFAQLKLKRYNEAVTTLKAAIALSPSYDTSHYYLGQVYVLTGNKTGANGEYRELQRSNSQYAEKLMNMINKM